MAFVRFASFGAYDYAVGKFRGLLDFYYDCWGRCICRSWPFGAERVRSYWRWQSSLAFGAIAVIKSDCIPDIRSAFLSTVDPSTYTWGDCLTRWYLRYWEDYLDIPPLPFILSWEET